MDKRTLLAIVLLLFIFIFYPHYIKKISPEPRARSSAVTQTGNMTKENGDLSSFESIGQSEQEEKTEEFALEERIFTIENSKITINVSSYGGAISTVFLNEYTDKESDSPTAIYSLSEEKEKQYYIATTRIATENGNFINSLNRCNYKVLKHDEKHILLISPDIDGITVTKEFALDDDGYVINLLVSINNNSQENISVGLECSNGIQFKESGKYARNFMGATAKIFDNYVTTKYGKLKKNGFVTSESADWLALERKYFTCIADPNYEVLSIRAITHSENLILGYLLSAQEVIAPNSSSKKSLLFYVGPKEYSTLKAIGRNFEKILTRGFFGGINLAILLTLNFLNNIFNNYGVSIIILTIIIKILFSPLTHKSFQSMRKMQELQPLMKELQDKYKDNPQQLNKEVMGLYKKHKANPMSGCLPILLQMPIFIALYQTLSRSVELRGASFIWWIKDLSEPDKMFTFPFSIPVIGDSFNLLPILMIASMIWQQRMTPSSATSKEQERIMFLMPIMFGFIFYGLPSGLVLYWLVNNILTASHQMIMKKVKH